MTPRLRRVVVSFLSQGTPRRGPLILYDGVIVCSPNITSTMISSSTNDLTTQRYMPFSSGTKFSTVDLRILTPTLVSSNRNAHSTPYFTLSEKRTLGVMTPEEVERRIDRIMVRCLHFLHLYARVLSRCFEKLMCVFNSQYHFFLYFSSLSPDSDWQVMQNYASKIAENTSPQITFAKNCILPR